jgi:DNA-binding MarR family transcriptional regulator
MPQMSTIEKLIVQKKFKSSYQKNMISLFYTVNLLSDYQQKLFKDSKITRQQYNALRILKGQYPESSTVGLIKERLIDKNSDASRMVDRLCKLEFVERLESKTDKRAVDVRITKKGLKLLDKLSDKVENFESPLRVLSKKESEILNTTLDKILGKFIEKK